MDSDRLSRWLTPISNLAVLIGIALVIFELSQNRQAIQAQTRTELATGIAELLSANMADSSYASILHRGNFGEPLTEVEQYQYARHRSAMVEYHENVYYQYQIGLFDEVDFRRQASVIRSDLDRFPGYGSIWCSMRDRMSPGMVAAVLAQSPEPLCDDN